MNWYPLLALLAFAYTGLVFWLTIKKPEKLWSISKIQFFVKALGERGTEIFFYVFGLAFAALGIWLLTL
ncbi:MAG: hypothetical protein WBB69_15200 [Anaerolineales bacterium]